MKKIFLFILLVFSITSLSACGNEAPLTVRDPTLTKANQICPQAANGDGHMDACYPPSSLPKTVAPLQIAPQKTYPDFSNNNPVFNLSPIARAAHPSVVVKINQGSYIDATANRMIQSARANRLSVGGYDFVQNYNAQEAYTFIGHLKSYGICNGNMTLPPTLDVEYGAFSYAGLQHMIAAVRRDCGRVQIYTGAWYWTPHAGCQWPSNVSGWLSGYPIASPVCGLPSSEYLVHQYTDSGFNGATDSDMNEFLGSSTIFNQFQNIQSKPTPPVPHSQLEQRRAVLQRLLVQYGCRARVKQHQKIGPKCRAWFAHGAAVDKALHIRP